MTETKELFLRSETEEPAGRTRGFASMCNKQPVTENKSKHIRSANNLGAVIHHVNSLVFVGEMSHEKHS